MGGMVGSSSTSGCINNQHSCSPWILIHPVSMFSLSDSNMDTVSLVERTFQYASQKGPIPTSELLKLVNV